MNPNFPVDRLFEGRPLISPTDHWWESGVTFNSAAIFLEPLVQNERALFALLGECDFSHYPDGVVVLHYRARPKDDPGRPWTRSFVGVSIHEPDLTPIKRFPHPVLEPGGLEHQADDQGIEDPRVTWFEGKWWMVYCGVALTGSIDPEKMWIGSVCTAWSEDLVHWHKKGPLLGDGSSLAHEAGLASVSNKDGLFFPDRINGKLMLLHRPMSGEMHTWGTNIAWSETPDGIFVDLGPVRKAMKFEGYESSWAGAGSVPIKLSEGVYLSIEHTGNYITNKTRKYVLDAFIYDFNNWDYTDPAALVAARFDDFMRPETDFEVLGPYEDSVANVVFSCGSYVYDDWLYIVYGGGDSHILAARLRLKEFVEYVMSRATPVTRAS